MMRNMQELQGGAKGVVAHSAAHVPVREVTATEGVVGALSRSRSPGIGRIAYRWWRP